MSELDNFSRHAHLRDKRTKTFRRRGRKEKNESGTILHEFDDFVFAIRDKQRVSENSEGIMRWQMLLAKCWNER